MLFRSGKTAALISAVDLLKGLGISMQMDVLNVPGATGYYDTDYAAKGKANFENCQLCSREKCQGRKAQYDKDLYKEKFA